MKSSKVNRRKFIQYSAALSSVVALSPILSHATLAKTNLQRDIYWYQRPLRILQTVLREPDAADYDAKAVVAYMEKTGSNTLVVNGGGVVDFFQNPLPASNVNSMMGNRDVLQ